MNASAEESLRAPLRSAVFRSLWAAMFATAIGSWMQTVGAQWLLVDEHAARTLVALVQTASMLPVVLFALPAGALADIFDKRRILLVVQLGLVAVGLLLTVLTAVGHLRPDLVLTLTFAFGVGQALTTPTFLAVVPELVDRAELPAASALSAIGQNVARAVGPAVAGLLIARVSVAVVFGVNTLAVAVFAVVLWRWRRDRSRDELVPEPFAAAVRAGGRYVRFAPVVRRMLWRLALFVVPASALWALLPLVARDTLGLGPDGYGILLAALGVGAIVGAFVLPKMIAKVRPGAIHVGTSLAFGAALGVLTLVPWPGALAALVLAGAAWVTLISSVNATLQQYLPAWVRGRGLAVYQIVFAAGLGAGSLVWGVLAELTNLSVAHLAAAAVMLAVAASVRIWPVGDVRGVDSSAAVWAEPNLTFDPVPRDGPMVVVTRYQVPVDRETQFVTAMRAVQLARQRTGAIRWGLFRAGEADQQFVEVYEVPSWDEHLRQHGGRLTGADHRTEQEARALASHIEASHLLPARDHAG